MQTSAKGYHQIAREIVRRSIKVLDAPAVRVAPTPSQGPSLCQWALDVKQIEALNQPKEWIRLAREPGVPKTLKKHLRNLLLGHLWQLAGQKQNAIAEDVASDMIQTWGAGAGAASLMGYYYYSQAKYLLAAKWFEQVSDWTTETPQHAAAYFTALLTLRDLTKARQLKNSCEVFLTASTPAFCLLGALLAEPPRLDESRLSHVLESEQSQTAHPVIPTVMAPFTNPLQRRIESPHAEPFETQAAQVVASAMRVEHGIAPYQKDAALTLARWLLLTGQAQNAWQVIETETQREATAFASGFAYFSLFAWMQGEERLAQAGLEQLDISTPATPVQHFARWVSLAVNGQVDRAMYCIARLHREDPEFFITQKSETLWGMLALALKAQGQEELAHKAWQLNLQTDRFACSREHLWRRVRIPERATPIPAFHWPAFLHKQVG